MVLLVDAAEELAVANEAARSEAVRNDKLLKQLKADTDRQLMALFAGTIADGITAANKVGQMNTQTSSAASVGAEAAERPSSTAVHTDASSVSSGTRVLFGLTAARHCHHKPRGTTVRREKPRRC